MFELDIQLKVKLHTGAEITLTEDQTRLIKNYTIGVVLGKPSEAVKEEVEVIEQPKKKRGRPKGTTKKVHSGWYKPFVHWTVDEENKLRILAHRYAKAPLRKHHAVREAELKEYIKTVTPNRTFKAVYAKFMLLRKELQVMSSPSTGWSPVSILVK